MEVTQTSNHQPKSPSNSTRRRVKLYQLGEKGEWEDKGTGHVTCSFLEKFSDMGLVVRAEKNEDQVLLETRVYKQDAYQVQQETLIVWTDPDTDTELALSFQEVAGCKEIWDQINTIQKLATAADSDDDGVSLNSTMYIEDELKQVESSFTFPAPNLNNLPKLVEIFSAPLLVTQKRELSNAVAKDNYFAKLFELFHTCEDLEDVDSLHMFFQIFKSIVLLNDPSLLEVLFSEEHVFDLMGTLEYDPELLRKQNHREYLKNMVVFREVVPFDNPALVAKIHMTFRISYMKDVVLPRLLDDPTFATLNSLIFFNNVEIVGQIQSDAKFLSEVFRRIKSPDIAPDQFKDLIMFIQELCNLAKALQPQNRVIFYQNLSKYGFLDIFELSIESKDVPVRLSIVNIIDSVLSHDPSLVRSFILSQKPSYSLFNKLIHAFLYDPEMGIRVQLVEVLRVLIDTSNMDESPDKESFLTMFYSDFIPKLMDPLSEATAESEGELSLVKESICDILSFCLLHHTYRIKYFVLGNNVIGKVLKLANIKDKPLTLAIVRFFRTFIGMKDDFYNRHITKNNLFETIINVFQENGPKYNLLNSAIIELFEFIRKENIKHLIQYLAENYSAVFKDVDYVETFKLLLLKYEQHNELNTSASSTSTLSASSNKEVDEEYFKETEEDDEKGPAFRNGLPEPSEFKPLTHDNTEEPSFTDVLRKSPARNGSDDEPKPLSPKKTKISFNLKSAAMIPRDEDADITDQDPKRRKVE